MKQSNPHGVTQRAVRRRCDCCYTDYETTALLDPTRCGPCREHHPNGSPEQQVECFREHATRYREIEKRAHDLVQRAVQGQREAEEGRRDALRQVAEALKSRNRYRGIYEAVIGLHEVSTDGRCLCGESPCPEREAAKEAEFQMHRNYET
jgi:hypothetical protein